MANMIQNNFVAGEISPALYGRSDLAAYYHACAVSENFIVSREGSLKKRHGIGMTATIAHPYASCRVIPYLYDRDEAGVVVFWRSGSAIYAQLRSKTNLATAGANATVYSGSCTDADIKSIHFSQIGDTIFANAKGLFNKKLVVTWSTLSLAVEDYAQRTAPEQVTAIALAQSGLSDTPKRTVWYGAYVVRDGILSEVKAASIEICRTWTAGGYVTVTVTHGQDVDAKDFDYILIGKKTGAFYGELARFYPEDVTGSTVEFQDENHTPTDMIYTQTNVLGDSFMPPLVTGAFQQRLCFANSSNHTDAQSGSSEFTAKNGDVLTVGSSKTVQYVFYKSSSKANWTDITSSCTISGTSITVGGVGTTKRSVMVTWTMSATTNELPMTLWFSAIGNLYNFYADRPAADDDPFSPTLMSTGPAFIRWLIPYQKALVVFTDAGIFAVSGSTTEGFTASTCQINKLSNIPVSQTVQPLESESGIVFVGSDDKTLYTLAYDLQTDSTRPVNRMMMVKHLTRKAKITSIALQQYPDQIVWCRLSDGTLAAFTFERDEEVYAWSRATASNISFLDVVGTGSVTDSSTDHTIGDIVFVGADTSSSFKLGTFRSDWQDMNTTGANVVAEMVTLPAESTQETIAFRTKNVKDVLVRLFESGPVKVMPYLSGLAEQTLNALGTSFSGDAKAKPYGYINDLGQMRFRSTGNVNAEILAVVTKMEVG